MNSDLDVSRSGGWIEVICGVMFSGKSEELIRRVRRAIIARRKIQVFKSHLDERYAGIYHISSHDGRTVQAVPIDTPEQIARALEADTQVVAIDEAQFLDPSIVALVTSLADRGMRVIVAGTDTDFRGEPFGPMPPHIRICVSSKSMRTAICVKPTMAIPIAMPALWPAWSRMDCPWFRSAFDRSPRKKSHLSSARNP